MKFCPECGKTWNGSKFCAECGKDLRSYINGGSESERAPVVKEEMAFSADFDFLDQIDNLAEKAESECKRIEAEAKAARKQRRKEAAEKSKLERNRKEKIAHDFEIEDGTLLKYHGNDDCVDLRQLPIKNIGQEAFKNCSIKSVCIGKLDSIGRSAFEGCGFLSTISGGGNESGVLSVKEVDMYAFHNCKNLTSIRFDDDLTEIARTAFDGCSSLQYVSIPDGIWNLHSLEWEELITIDSRELTSEQIAVLIKKHSNRNWERSSEKQTWGW